MANDPFDYLESRNDADELIRDFGNDLVVQVRRSVKSGPASNPTYSNEDFPTFGVKVEFSRRQVQSGNVLANDERWLVAAGPLAALGVVDVTPFQKLVVADVELPLFKVDPLKPAATVVLFDCHVRK